MKKNSSNYKLIGSDTNLERLKKTLNEKWFCGAKKEYRLLEDNTFGVFYAENSPKAGQQLTNLRIISIKGRFRFEILDN